MAKIKLTKDYSKKGKKFKKSMTIGEALKLDERAGAVFMGFGMHCFGCPVSQMETLEEAAMVHGVEVDFLIEKLNELQELPKDEK